MTTRRPRRLRLKKIVSGLYIDHAAGVTVAAEPVWLRARGRKWIAKWKESSSPGFEPRGGARLREQAPGEGVNENMSRRAQPADSASGVSAGAQDKALALERRALAENDIRRRICLLRRVIVEWTKVMADVERQKRRVLGELRSRRAQEVTR